MSSCAAASGFFRASASWRFRAATRASVSCSASSARAALDGRDFVIPDDVKQLAPALLRHRLILSPAAEIDGRRIDDVVTGLIDATEAPR